MKERFDREQPPSLEYGGSNELEAQCMYQKSDARPRHGYVGRKAERRRDTEPAGDIGRSAKAFKPQKRSCRGPGVRSLAAREISGRHAQCLL